MNRADAKHFSDILKAYADGKTIQHRGQRWHDIPSPNFDDPPEHYRVKPDVEYRPYMFHEVPVGIVVIRKPGTGTESHYRGSITGVKEDDDTSTIFISIGGASRVDSEALFRFWTKVDGSPCGMLVN